MIDRLQTASAGEKSRVNVGADDVERGWNGAGLISKSRDGIATFIFPQQKFICGERGP